MIWRPPSPFSVVPGSHVSRASLSVLSAVFRPELKEAYKCSTGHLALMGLRGKSTIAKIVLAAKLISLYRIRSCSQVSDIQEMDHTREVTGSSPVSPSHTVCLNPALWAQWRQMQGWAARTADCKEEVRIPFEKLSLQAYTAILREPRSVVV